MVQLNNYPPRRQFYLYLVVRKLKLLLLSKYHIHSRNNYTENDIIKMMNVLIDTTLVVFDEMMYKTGNTTGKNKLSTTTCRLQQTRFTSSMTYQQFLDKSNITRRVSLIEYELLTKPNSPQCVEFALSYSQFYVQC